MYEEVPLYDPICRNNGSPSSQILVQISPKKWLKKAQKFQTPKAKDKQNKNRIESP